MLTTEGSAGNVEECGNNVLLPLARVNPGCLLCSNSTGDKTPTSKRRLLMGRILKLCDTWGQFVSSWLRKQLLCRLYFIVLCMTVPWEVHINSDGSSDKSTLMTEKIRCAVGESFIAPHWFPHPTPPPSTTLLWNNQHTSWANMAYCRRAARIEREEML